MTTRDSARPAAAPSEWRPVWEIIRFELMESLRTRFLLITFGVFFIIGFLTILATGTDWPIFAALRSPVRPGELIPYATSPLAIMNIISQANILLAIVAVGIFADRATKDFAYSVDGLLFTTPLQEWQFAAGRFIAAFLISLFISLGLGVGLLLAQALPWMDPVRIAPFNFLSYVQPYLYLVIPNLLIFGLFSFATGLLTRRTLPSYLALVGLIFAGSIVVSLFRVLNLDQFFLVLAQPFGNGTIDYTVRFWTKVQNNTLTVPFAPIIWLSRLLFLALSVAFFAWVWRRFSFAGATSSAPGSRLGQLLEWGEQRLMFWMAQLQPEPAAGNPKAGEALAQLPAARPSYGYGAQVRQVWHIAKTELQRLVWKPLFLAVLTISILIMVVLVGSSIRDGSGALTLPITGYLVEVISLMLSFLAPLLIIFLAGDLVWREREAKVDALIDPLPVRSWVVVVGKLLALASILVLTLVLLTVASVITQTVNGYTHYELGAYWTGLFTVILLDLVFISVLTITIQVLINQKFVAYFVSAALIIGLLLFGDSPALKNVRLLEFGYRPDFYYSQMSGFGRMLEPVRWFQLYWLAVAVLLIGVAVLFWVRGVETQPGIRWQIAKQRFTRPLQGVMGLGAIAALAAGGWIFYNTSILNASTDRAQVEAQVIAYEQAYGPLIDHQPKITAIKLEVDIYPGREARLAARGIYPWKIRPGSPSTRFC
jgi:ABC-type transport system involved in multi-copper enzyme maturation permease subunit